MPHVPDAYVLPHSTLVVVLVVLPTLWFPRNLSNFPCSDFVQTWYACSLWHSLARVFTVFKNFASPPPKKPQKTLFFRKKNYRCHFPSSDSVQTWHGCSLRHSPGLCLGRFSIVTKNFASPP